MLKNYIYLKQHNNTDYPHGVAEQLLEHRKKMQRIYAQMEEQERYEKLIAAEVEKQVEKQMDKLMDKVAKEISKELTK